MDNEEEWERRARRYDQVLAELRNIKEIVMATQEQVDALTASIAQVSQDLASSSAAIQAELDALKSANPSLDLSALEAAVAPLDDAVKAVGALTPSQPTPPPPAPAV